MPRKSDLEKKKQRVAPGKIAPVAETEVGGNRKFGMFTLATDVVRDSPGIVAQVFSMLGLVPFRVEADFASDSLLYWGWSPEFRDVPQGEYIPEYEIVVSMAQDSDGDESEEYVGDVHVREID